MSSTSSPSEELDLLGRFAGSLKLENGSPFRLEPFQRTMLVDYFDGCRETLILISKKNGKSSLIAVLALYHLMSTPDAECVIAAASRDQAGIMLRQAQGFIRRSPKLQDRLLVKQREIVHRKLGGRIRILASDVDTADGVIPTLALVDELHRHKSADLYGIFRDGLGPRQGRMVTISTAGDDEDSPLGQLRQKAYGLPGMETDGFYRHVRASGFAMHEWSLEANLLPDEWPPSDESLALTKLVNPAPWQTGPELKARSHSPSMTRWQWARFANGVWGLGTERAFDPERWDECSAPAQIPKAQKANGSFDKVLLEELVTGRIPHGRPVTLGFDGSRFHDDTGLVAVDIQTGFIQVVGHWQRPVGADLDFEIPEDEVDQTVDWAFHEWQVWRLYGDPPYWESALDRWAGDHGEKKVIRWWTNRIKQTALALRAFRNDMEPAKMAHDGDTRLAEHMKNAAVRWTKMRDGNEFLWTIGKDGPKSPRKIDLAMAAMLAWEARGDAITSGDWDEPEYSTVQW